MVAILIDCQVLDTRIMTV
jgi:hypothetical protein